MNIILEKLGELRQMTLVDVIDVLLVAFILYKLLMLIRGTRSWRIAGGMILFVAVFFLSSVLKLNTLHYLLDKALPLGPVALVILFLPELRQALEGVGKLGLWPQKLGLQETQTEVRTVEELVAAAAELASARIGALIVIEKGAPLDDIIGNGVLINARVSAPLLGSIFYEGNPLHDGAVVIRGDTIVAAACRLPLSESSRLDPSVHMRHRAAIGITENVDCLSIAISEERGTISVSTEGRLRKLANHQELRDVLNREIRGEEPDPPSKPKRSRVRRSVGAKP